VRIIAVSADTQEESADLSADIAIPFSLLHDLDLKAAKAYGVAMKGQDIAVPSLFILRKGGQIVTSYIGENMSDRPNGIELLRLLKEKL
jgi:peroxiredoxin